MVLVRRLLAIADEPADDDDERLRKRFGVAVGYIAVVAPFSVAGAAPGRPIALPLGVSLSLICIANLIVLARSRRFDRYVRLLLASGMSFTLLAVVIQGGVQPGGAGILWAFLVPVYAILALGPGRATIWFAIFVAGVALLVLVDPLVFRAFPPLAYPLRLASFAFSTIVPAAIIFIGFRYSDLRRREAQQRSDELLFNAIPKSIAARLKRGEGRIAESYPDTTVVFADIEGFTAWAQRTDPAQVVSLLDALFSSFDGLAADRGVEKIKTIGDAYMAVAGAPAPRADHAEAGLAFARGMLGAADEWRREHELSLNLRIGLASGTVVGGVIGQDRILFDLWGDTVNLAARMEASGVAGRIQVAPSSWELLRDRYPFEARDGVEVKGMGPMTTYLLAEETAAAEDERRLRP